MRSWCLKAVNAGMRLKTTPFGTFNALWPFAQSVSATTGYSRLSDGDIVGCHEGAKSKDSSMLLRRP
jgi:hypothetical protein